MTTAGDNTIRSCISNSVPIRLWGAAETEIEAVIRALETREAFLVDSLTRYAKDQGANVTEVEGVLSALGMHMPVAAPEPVEESEPQPAAGTDIDARITRLEQAVATLTSLAERHLGASV